MDASSLRDPVVAKYSPRWKKFERQVQRWREQGVKGMFIN